MAFKSWLVSLKSDVSNVSAVQAPIHAGLQRYAIETAGVSNVSKLGVTLASDTADTAAQNQPYHAEPRYSLGCTGDTADTCKKIDTEADTVNQCLNELLNPYRLKVDPTAPTPDPNRWCWPHSDAMNSREIDTFTARVHQFMGQGLAESEAEKLADKLVQQDRGDGAAVKQQPTVAAKPDQPIKQFKPWLTEREATTSKAYHQHHFQCRACKAAGRGEHYGSRCTVGLALWGSYTLTGAPPVTHQ